MSLRLIPALLLLVAAVALAQDGQAPQVAPGYANPRVDFGIVVSDIERSKAFYEQALGLTEASRFTAPGDLAAAAGLADNLSFEVHVMQLGTGPAATQVKLMEFKGARPHRPDNAFIHSTYGVRYLTFYVDDVTAALDRAAGHGVKPIAQGPQAFPDSIAPGMGLAVVRDPDGNFIELVGPFKK
jgi:catechol 2,3-dioxygenase-like lactoylglutathione lyase family enzyme